MELGLSKERTHKKHLDYCDVCGDFNPGKNTECVPFLSASGVTVKSEESVVSAPLSLQDSPNSGYGPYPSMND